MQNLSTWLKVRKTLYQALWLGYCICLNQATSINCSVQQYGGNFICMRDTFGCSCSSSSTHNWILTSSSRQPSKPAITLVCVCVCVCVCVYVSGKKTQAYISVAWATTWQDGVLAHSFYVEFLFWPILAQAGAGAWAEGVLWEIPIIDIVSSCLIILPGRLHERQPYPSVGNEPPK